MTSPSTVERFCIFCDADRQVHALTGRCQSCGRSTGDPLPRTSNGPVMPPARSATKLVLTETAELRRWVDLTRSLAEKLKGRSVKAEQFADRFRSEAQE